MCFSPKPDTISPSSYSSQKLLLWALCCHTQWLFLSLHLIFFFFIFSIRHSITLLLARLTFLLKDIDVFPFLFGFMACNFLTFQLIFLILAGCSAPRFSLEFLCLCDLRDHIWFRQYMKWIDSFYILSTFESRSSLNLILNSRLKYSTTSLASKFEHLTDTSNLTCQKWNSAPISHPAALPVFCILVATISFPLTFLSHILSTITHQTLFTLPSEYIHLHDSLYNSLLTVNVSFQ